MNKTTKRLLYALIAIVIIAIFAAPKLKMLTSNGNDITSPQSSQSQAIPVEGFIVKSDRLEHKIFATGTVVANEEVELRSETSGMITNIYFEEGSRVQKDDLLLKINDADLQAQLLKQKYQLELATDREGRQKQLLEKNLISQENYDFALNALNTVKADIAFLEAQIRKTEIHAPFDGIIGLKYISQGSYITPTTRIANLIDLDPIKIDFSVPEKYANNVRKGDRFTYKIVGAEKTYQGTVLAVEPKIDPGTRTLQIRGLSPNESSQILPGAFAEVDLVIRNIAQAVMVPTVALIPELQGQKVFLYQNGKATSKSVTTGIRTDTRVQILDGLAPGDTLITSGILQIRPGTAVRLTGISK